MPDRNTVLAKVRTALKKAREDDDLDVRAEDHLVDDLGFDSASMATLTIALEDEFDDVLLLSDWIGSASNPSELTVDSLVDYLVGLLSDAG